MALSATPPPSRRGWVRQAIWVLVILVAAAAIYRSRTSIRVIPAGEARVVGELNLVDSEGRPRALADLQGRVVLVNLWASWCGPCRREVPRVSRVHERLKSRGLTVWAINAESFEGEELRRAAAEIGIDYPVLTPLGEPGAVLGGGEVLPYTWLIDRVGRLRAAHGGLVSEASLRRACRILLEEPL